MSKVEAEIREGMYVSHATSQLASSWADGFKPSTFVLPPVRATTGSRTCSLEELKQLDNTITGKVDTSVGAGGTSE